MSNIAVAASAHRKLAVKSTSRAAVLMIDLLTNPMLKDSLDTLTFHSTGQ
jgi:hypothetical protein